MTCSPRGCRRPDSSTQKLGVQKDLNDRAGKWDRIAALATKPPISPLRTLDMVDGWLGKRDRGNGLPRNAFTGQAAAYADLSQFP